MIRTKRLLAAVGLLLALSIGGNIALPFVFGYPALFRTPFVTDDQRRRFWASISLFADQHNFASADAKHRRTQQERVQSMRERGNLASPFYTILLAIISAPSAFPDRSFARTG